MNIHEKRKASCDDCFFQRNDLCALGRKKACPTFRPAIDDAQLTPPPQLQLAFRGQDHGVQRTFFRSANEQLQLYKH